MGKAGKWTDVCYMHNSSTLRLLKYFVHLSIVHNSDYIENILPFNKHFTIYWVIY